MPIPNKKPAKLPSLEPAKEPEGLTVEVPIPDPDFTVHIGWTLEPDTVVALGVKPSGYNDYYAYTYSVVNGAGFIDDANVVNSADDIGAWYANAFTNDIAAMHYTGTCSYDSATKMLSFWDVTDVVADPSDGIFTIVRKS